MTREYTIGLIAAGLLGLITAAILWWPERSGNTPVPVDSQTTSANGADTIGTIQTPPQVAPKSALEKELESMPEATRSRLNRSGDSEPIERIDADLSRIDWRPMYNYLDENAYPRDFDKLKALAEEGDENAAYFLATTLEACRMHGPPPMSEEKFAEELQMIRHNHQVPQYSNGERTVVDIAQLNMPSSAAEFLAKYHYDMCRDMPMEHRGDADSWMVLAAENGSQVAKSVLASQRAVLGDPSGFLALWDDGYTPALSSLSGFYDRQYESRVDPEGHVKSFAYWLAFREMYYASRQVAGPGMQPFFGGIELSTHQRYDELVAWQIAEARDMAADILRDRPANCCTSVDVPKYGNSAPK